jgi:glycosyltransferase involved in cell wall biosynthesis
LSPKVRHRSSNGFGMEHSIDSAARTPDPGDSEPVVILMATYNGARFLQDQLESIAAQDHTNWHLVISDDGSTDQTGAIAASFAVQSPKVRLQTGPRAGATANFMSLLARQPICTPQNWIAFCDQDDVWLPDRLSRGIAGLARLDPARPALFCSRTLIVDQALKAGRLSAARPRATGFRNALVQNIAAGNTILLNPAAARLAIAAAARQPDPVVHDWWLYQLITGAGGQIVHDDRPTLLYRQHGVNEIGANDGGAARLKRVLQLLNGQFNRWNAKNITALRSASDLLTLENRGLLEGFAALHDKGFAARLRGLHHLGLYRQTTISSLALWLAAAIKRL